MDLTTLGWNADLTRQFAPHQAKGLVPARVAVEDKHSFRVWTADAELPARVTGKCIHEARGCNSKLPKVGDWVAVKLVPNEEKAMIQAILPRRTQLCRKMTGRATTEHILATNIDTAFMVAAADATFNAARLEQMLVMAHESGARPVVLLNKIDLCADLDAKLADATRVAGGALVLAACALTGQGVKKLAQLIKPGDTAVFIGTSGVGKSSLINRLYGEEIIRVSIRWICATMGYGFSIVNISSAIFDCSAPDLESCPDESLPEFAFIGRSNVGKSSLLNMLAGEQGLARVSPTPGFTRLINVFTMNKCWRLVDLPGYGFAHGARKDRVRLSQTVTDYLENRTNLCLVFALIESGLAPQEIDLEFVEWLVRHAVPFVIVFTKTDKVCAVTAQTNIAAFTDRISAWFEKPPAVFTCSAATRQGRQELLGVIDEEMTAIEAASIRARVPTESSPNLSLEARFRENRKRRPDLNRPW